MLTQKLQRRFVEGEALVRTRKGTTQLLQELTVRAISSVVADAFVTFGCQEFAVREITRMLCEFVISLVGALSLSSVNSQVPHQNFVDIVHVIGEEKRAGVLRELRASYINIQKLEARASEVIYVAQYVKSLQ